MDWTKVISVFGFLTLISATHAVEPSLYQRSQGLCFDNKAKEFQGSVPILGRLARKTGACQGMSAIVAAFMERAEFVPEAKRLDRDLLQQDVLRIIHQYRRGCPQRKIRISGYQSLQDLCQSNKDFFIRQSVLNNTNIALREIANHLPDFLLRTDKPIRAIPDQVEMSNTLGRFRKFLAAGRKPLLLSYSHVRTVLGLREKRLPDGTFEVVISLYDSNDNGLHFLKVKLDRNRLPSVGQKKFWDVTPNRGC